MISLKQLWLTSILVLLFSSIWTTLAFAESQGSDFKGITDPFGDPANYEFSEDEKEDKEFFHLGRYMMFGADLGLGFFTGGLGRTNSPAFMIGGKMVYFFDKSIALEASIHYGKHTDTIEIPNNGTHLVFATTMIPILAAFRYHFDPKNAPRAIALANPYLVGGGGLYIRQQEIEQNTTGIGFVEPSTSNMNYGGFFGAGAEFNVYRKHIYMGLDLRYHFVFFLDEDEVYNNLVEAGSRGGDYMTTVFTITYNF